MSTINPSSAKRFTVEIYRREGRTAAEIDGDRDGSHQKRQSRKMRRSQSPSHGMSN